MLAVTGRLRRLRPARILAFCGVLVLVVAGCLALRGALSRDMARERAFYLVNAARHGFKDGDIAILLAGADPGVIRIASRRLPGAPPMTWPRPEGWARYDIDTAPTLGLTNLSMEDARRINGVIPNSQLDNPPAEPFALQGAERGEAVRCMTTAIYYEAALEPREGQEAVAQVILNRMRHADYPKSVCGVVFQGASRPGCQFSFACDGSMARPPAAWAWKNAKDVAERALSGFVQKAVGTATHYHTTWIMARWTPTLVKVRQIGQHIFFRPPGSAGMPSAFRLAYAGGEARVSRVDLIGKPAALVAAPDLLIQASADGSMVAPRSIVQGGRMIVMPPSTVYLGGVHGTIRDTAVMVQTPQGQPPMHAMIAMRAAAVRAVRAAEREQAALAQAREAEEAANTPPAAASLHRPAEAVAPAG